MAGKLGAIFLTCAMGPVNYAGACIQASRMPEGIEELSPDGLLGGLRRGVEQAAKLAGVRAEDVERVLPMAEARARLDRLALSHKAALEAWAVHAGQIGGLLQGVAELTVDGRAPDASLCLERLARKVQRDQPFSEPLQALADDVARWQEIVSRCRVLLDEGGGALAMAYRRRRIRNTIAIAASSMLVAAAVSVVLYVRIARARVDAVLAGPDACLARGLDAGVLARASSEQRRAVEERVNACAEREAREARDLEARRRMEALAQEEERRRAERVSRCKGLAVRVRAGKLTPEDEAFAGEGAELLRRLAQRKIFASDIGPGEPSLPCADTAAGGDLITAYVDAVVASVWKWVPMGDPNEKLGDLLSARRAELPERAKTMLAVRAELASKQAIRTRDSAAIARAARLCSLSAALDFADARACDAMAEMAAKTSRGNSAAPRQAPLR